MRLCSLTLERFYLYHHNTALHLQSRLHFHLILHHCIYLQRLHICSTIPKQSYQNIVVYRKITQLVSPDCINPDILSKCHWLLPNHQKHNQINSSAHHFHRIALGLILFRS